MNRTCECGRPTGGEWLCPDCQTTFKWALANVTAHYADLDTIAAKRARYNTLGATKSGVGKEQPLVVDMRFTDTTAAGTQLRWDTWSTIVAWARTVMEDQPPLQGPACPDCLHISCSVIRRRRWPRNTIASMIAYLARQFRHITSQEWAPHMYDEILDLERRLTRMIDRPADRWYAGRCSVTDESDNTCETELYARSDRGKIVCPGCGIEHDVAERRGVLLDEAKDYLVTASEAAGALMAWTDYDGNEKRLIDLIAKWREGRLEVRGTTEVHGQDRLLYRLGDVQDLMIEQAQRDQERRIKAS